MVDRTTPITPGERAWLDRLITPLPRGAAILDLGCGGGEPIDRYLIDRGFQIVGIDHRAQLIDLARTRFPRHRWLLGDMRTIALDERFAAVLAWNSLSLPSPADQAAMAERAAAWLLQGGRLLFSAVPAEGADFSTALVRRGLIEIAHVENDRSGDAAAVWLARKP